MNATPRRTTRPNEALRRRIWNEFMAAFSRAWVSGKLQRLLRLRQG